MGFGPKVAASCCCRKGFEREEEKKSGPINSSGCWILCLPSDLCIQMYHPQPHPNTNKNCGPFYSFVGKNMYFSLGITMSSHHENISVLTLREISLQ